MKLSEMIEALGHEMVKLSGENATLSRRLAETQSQPSQGNPERTEMLERFVDIIGPYIEVQELAYDNKSTIKTEGMTQIINAYRKLRPKGGGIIADHSGVARSKK